MRPARNHPQPVRAAPLLGAALVALAALSLPCAARAAGEVKVYRGHSTQGPPPSPAATANGEGGGQAYMAGAGRRLWLVAPEAGRVQACTVERTTRVGGRRLRCVEGDLPN